MSEPRDTETAYRDHYRCPECDAEFSVVDYEHRTHVGYDSATVRCEKCGSDTVRIE